MFSHIKDSDLNFAGISMGFAAINGDGHYPNKVHASDRYYDRPEAHVPLVDGKTLHAVIGGSNGIKLTLIDGTATKGIELGWVSHQVMKNAIEVSHGLLEVNGESLVIAKVPMPLRRMLAGIQ
ncbi:MAG: hypothetical protein HZB12_01145 [Candidatus Yonathbacteria bacterium]|nr:hypothetical protein [Candidatus Yonathbacteria bacterium]